MTEKSITDNYNHITELYETFHNELYKWCCMMTQDEFLSQELVQECGLL